MSLVLRSTLRAGRVARQQMQVRSLHIENKVDQTIPGGNKALAIKVIIYGTVGISLPFIAAKISQDKARGGN